MSNKVQFDTITLPETFKTQLLNVAISSAMHDVNFVRYKTSPVIVFVLKVHDVLKEPCQCTVEAFNTDYTNNHIDY